MGEGSLAPCPCGQPATHAVWLDGLAKPRCNAHGLPSPDHAGCRAALAREADLRRAAEQRAERAADMWDHWEKRGIMAEQEWKRHEARAERLAGLLRRLEWADGLDGVGGYCFLCGQFASQGHAPDCDFVAALADADADRGSGE